MRRMRSLATLVDGCSGRVGGDLAGRVWAASKVGDPLASSYATRILHQVGLAVTDKRQGDQARCRAQCSLIACKCQKPSCDLPSCHAMPHVLAADVTSHYMATVCSVTKHILATHWAIALSVV